MHRSKMIPTWRVRVEAGLLCPYKEDIKMRIVSLIASSTEIVTALGFEGALVGRSHECDFPASVRRLPPLTSPKFSPDGTSYQIDERVKAILQEGLSVYRVDGERLRELQPDVIVTQVQCEVCAVSRKDVDLALREFVGPRPRIIDLNPNSLADIWADIRKVAEGLGAPERGEALVTRLKERMAQVHPAEAGPRPRVASIEWIDPLMAGGNWMPELIAMAGGQNLFGEAGKHSPFMSWEKLRAEDPDVLVVTPCGFDIPRTLSELPALESREGWGALKAVRAGRVFVADGNQYFNRPGPRVVESLEILADMFRGENRFGHEGTGWVRTNRDRTGTPDLRTGSRS